jgi:hypothetical protein
VERFGIKRIVSRLTQLKKEYGSFYEPNAYLVNYNRT